MMLQLHTQLQPCSLSLASILLWQCRLLFSYERCHRVRYQPLCCRSVSRSASRSASPGRSVSRSPARSGSRSPARSPLPAASRSPVRFVLPNLCLCHCIEFDPSKSALACANLCIPLLLAFGSVLFSDLRCQSLSQFACLCFAA